MLLGRRLTSRSRLIVLGLFLLGLTLSATTLVLACDSCTPAAPTQDDGSIDFLAGSCGDQSQPGTGYEVTGTVSTPSSPGVTATSTVYGSCNVSFDNCACTGVVSAGGQDPTSAAAAGSPTVGVPCSPDFGYTACETYSASWDTTDVETTFVQCSGGSGGCGGILLCFASVRNQQFPGDTFGTEITSQCT
jgi:hypothetical protein